MSIICRRKGGSTNEERAFCQALLADENFLWDDDYSSRRSERVIRLPPEDFVYGIKHEKQNGMTGVAAALQHDDTPTTRRQSKDIPDFIKINKIATRLGLTKVRDIHQYRRMMNNHQLNPTRHCFCPPIRSPLITDMIHGRVAAEQPSMRDLIENKYLHEWLRQEAVRRCKWVLS